MDEAELVMRQLAVEFDTAPVYDRSRILRVPGTFNHKCAVYGTLPSWKNRGICSHPADASTPRR